MELLGIDKNITEKQRTTKYDSNWNGVREFFKDKISQVKEARNNAHLTVAEKNFNRH